MHELVIKLEGFPETVQHIADVIDDAFPSRIAWIQAADAGTLTIKVEGYEMPSMPTHIVGDLAA